MTARVPISDFCRTRTPVEFPMALLLPVFRQYEPSFRPNAFLEQLPNNYEEAGALLQKRMKSK